MKKCRPVVKEPSGGTLLFRCALPARGASLLPLPAAHGGCLCLGAACTGCILCFTGRANVVVLCLGAACTGCIFTFTVCVIGSAFASALPARGASRQSGLPAQSARTLPRRCLHGVHRCFCMPSMVFARFASALPARGASHVEIARVYIVIPLPRRCLHGVHPAPPIPPSAQGSTLPRRCLHGVHLALSQASTVALSFASALPARGASAKADKLRHTIL